MARISGKEKITQEESMVEIKKIPGGYNVDGFDLKNGKCGCTSVLKCCFSWSKVKVKDTNFVVFCKSALKIDPPSASNFDPPQAVICCLSFSS